jgi:hypothetical protein
LSEQYNHEPVKHESVERQQSLTAKRLFIEPAVSEPVDVLDATTFFQVVTGGTTVDPGIV